MRSFDFIIQYENLFVNSVSIIYTLLINESNTSRSLGVFIKQYTNMFTSKYVWVLLNFKYI